jgi:hypothetical protein
MHLICVPVARKWSQCRRPAKWSTTNQPTNPYIPELNGTLALNGTRREIIITGYGQLLYEKYSSMVQLLFFRGS